MNHTHLAEVATVEKTIEKLQAHGIRAEVVPTAEAAKARVLELLPAGAEVMTMTSVTLDTIGLTKEINESGKFAPVRAKLNDTSVDSKEKRRLGAAPDYAVGSVHAVTESGEVFIASNTGSQLPAYLYGAGHVIWVVSTQKIVKDFDGAMKRIYDHVLPLESERAKKAYGVAGSFVSKLAIVNQEINKDRIKLIFVSEVLGY
jgi:hypothetical protein